MHHRKKLCILMDIMLQDHNHNWIQNGATIIPLLSGHSTSIRIYQVLPRIIARSSAFSWNPSSTDTEGLSGGTTLLRCWVSRQPTHAWEPIAYWHTPEPETVHVLEATHQLHNQQGTPKGLTSWRHDGLPLDILSPNTCLKIHLGFARIITRN